MYTFVTERRVVGRLRVPLAAHSRDPQSGVTRGSLVCREELEKTPFVLWERGCGSIRNFKKEANCGGRINAAQIPRMCASTRYIVNFNISIDNNLKYATTSRSIT
jgi:hypothetical protein